MAEEETIQPDKPSPQDVLKAAMQAPVKGVRKIQESIAEGITGAQKKLKEAQEAAAEAKAMKAEAKAEAQAEAVFRDETLLKDVVAGMDAKFAEIDAQFDLIDQSFEAVTFRLKKKGILVELPKPPEPEPEVEEVPADEPTE